MQVQYGELVHQKIQNKTSGMRMSMRIRIRINYLIQVKQFSDNASNEEYK